MQRISWYKAKFEDEKDEFLRIEKEHRIPYKALRAKYAVTNTPILLPNSWWAKLENTDSWKCKTFTQVTNIIGGYKRPLYSLGFILDSLLQGKKCELPIVLAYADKQGNQRLTLIAGNTRLCVCKAAKIPPKVILLDFIGNEDN